jgi:hypothetical protein
MALFISQMLVSFGAIGFANNTLYALGNAYMTALFTNFSCREFSEVGLPLYGVLRSSFPGHKISDFITK